MKYLKSILEKFMAWIEHFAHSKWKMHVLFWVAFFEQSFSIVMPDILIAPIAMYKKYSALYVSLFAAVASTLGGFFTYIVASIYGERLMSFLKVTEYLESTKQAYNDNVFLAMLFASFTPVPDKIFSVFGGVFQVNLFWFLLALFLGKFTRYYIVAYFSEKYGLVAKDKIMKDLGKWFTYFIIFLVLIFVLFYFKNTIFN